MATSKLSLKVAALLALGTTLLAANAGAATRTGYIVEAHAGAPVAVAAAAVRHVGGRVTHELPIINAVSATLTQAQAAKLRKNQQLDLFADAPLKTQGNPPPDIYQRAAIGADLLAAQGINGAGVVVAVVDSGFLVSHQYITKDLNGTFRVLVRYDAIAGAVSPPGSAGGQDLYGHGTHVTSLILSSNTADPVLNGQPEGIAPMAKLVSVRAFDHTGSSSYSTVLNGLNWILANKNTYGNGGIRVVNLSFGAAPQSYYWNDPIDQAVMKLWQAGIVVVASAGNSGPAEQTISVPGNTPYAITVGAMTDNWTPNNPAGHGIASFSSTGPTVEGFVKPDLVAPGGHVAGLMDKATQSLAAAHPQFQSGTYRMFIMSGTSQSAAVVTGAVALMLQANPSLTPDQVKCHLMASASSLLNSSNKAAYSVFQQGTGLINAYDAVYSQAANCANQGLNIANDLAGTAHYAGPAQQDRTTGLFYVVDNNGFPVLADGYLWNKSFAKNQGYLWNKGYLWNQSTVAPASAPAATESWNNEE